MKYVVFIEVDQMRIKVKLMLDGVIVLNLAIGEALSRCFGTHFFEDEMFGFLLRSVNVLWNYCCGYDRKASEFITSSSLWFL